MLWYDIMVCHEEEEVSNKRVAGLSVGSNVTNIWRQIERERLFPSTMAWDPLMNSLIRLYQSDEFNTNVKFNLA